MAVFRVEKNRDYTVMANHHLRDDRLSLKAIGLLSKILGLPDDWEYTVSGLAEICRDGERAVKSALRELEDAGYISREQTRDESGAFRKMMYVIREVPVGAEDDAESPSVRNAPTAEEGESESPSVRNAPARNALARNDGQLNTNSTKYVYTNIPPYSPPTGGKRPRRSSEPKTEPDWMPDRFDAFWESYPRGENKQGAIRAWDKLRADDSLLREMALGLMAQLNSEDWKRGIGIPHAATWINQRRWEDIKKPALNKTEDVGPTLPEGAYRL